ncbi:MAG: hypothetical protein NVS4B11_13790 [Ktedonobacteraceae bacterium]
MGQYRQWLHYRQVDRQLHTQKEHLTTALARLQAQITCLDAPPLDTNNCVIQALTLSMKTSATSSQVLITDQSLENEHLQQPEAISQALFDHSRLPDLEPTLAKDRAEPALSEQPMHTWAPPIPHKAIDFIPEDMVALVDEHTQTEPQIALPWWLHNATLAATQGNGLDQQNIRTNKLVQRWLERWGRQENQASQPAKPNGYQADTQQEGR